MMYFRNIFKGTFLLQLLGLCSMFIKYKSLSFLEIEEYNLEFNDFIYTIFSVFFLICFLKSVLIKRIFFNEKNAFSIKALTNSGSIFWNCIFYTNFTFVITLSLFSIYSFSRNYSYSEEYITQHNIIEYGLIVFLLTLTISFIIGSLIYAYHKLKKNFLIRPYAFLLLAVVLYVSSFILLSELQDLMIERLATWEELENKLPNSFN